RSLRDSPANTHSGLPRLMNKPFLIMYGSINQLVLPLETVLEALPEAVVEAVLDAGSVLKNLRGPSAIVHMHRSPKWSQGLEKSAGHSDRHPSIVHHVSIEDDAIRLQPGSIAKVDTHRSPNPSQDLKRFVSRSGPHPDTVHHASTECGTIHRRPEQTATVDMHHPPNPIRD
ncbi:MAG TPA: hypothetical protein VN151_04210, partial [Terracidiphilus sp.]|nr:hypothetical protein [Terracidiphilus sp.]